MLTAPFPVLRHVEVLTPFSAAKQRAIRQLHYDASAKVFLQFRRRFWEDDDGIVGRRHASPTSRCATSTTPTTAARPAAA